MGIVVKKFGGTSVGDIRRIKRVAHLIADYRRQYPHDPLIVVVSAMAGETNRLIALARNCVPNPPARELDVLVATGEQVSVALLAMALIECGIAARSFLAHQAGIRTDTRFTNAQITEISESGLASVVADGTVAVVAGFQGFNAKGEITTLGRGGSDITAVAIAAALQASACYIYTDVPGVFSTDPRLCADARIWPSVTHDEMLELATLGAKVLHPRSVYFAKRYQVPLVVLSAFEEPVAFRPDAGTWIVPTQAEPRPSTPNTIAPRSTMEKPIVTGIALKLDEARLTVRGVPDPAAALNELCAGLHGRGISMDMLTQSTGSDQLSELTCLVPDDRSSEALALAREVLPSLRAIGAELDRDIARVSVVGVGMRNDSSVAATVFQILRDQALPLRMVSSSDITISLVTTRKYAEQAVRLLHSALIGTERSETNVVNR